MKEETKAKLNVFAERLAKLIDIKSIVTLAVTIVVCYLAWTQKMDIKDFFALVMMVFTYFFTKRKEQA